MLQWNNEQQRKKEKKITCNNDNNDLQLKLAKMALKWNNEQKWNNVLMG